MTDQIDAIAKALASKAPRRTVLKLLGGTVTASVGAAVLGRKAEAGRQQSASSAGTSRSSDFQLNQINQINQTCQVNQINQINQTDTTAPTTTVTAVNADDQSPYMEGDVALGDVDVTFTATDSGGSCVQEIRINGVPYPDGTTLTASSPGETTFTYQAVDFAGNVEPARTFTVTITEYDIQDVRIINNRIAVVTTGEDNLTMEQAHQVCRDAGYSRALGIKRYRERGDRMTDVTCSL